MHIHTVNFVSTDKYRDLPKALGEDYDNGYARASLTDDGVYTVEGYYRHGGHYVGMWDSVRGVFVGVICTYIQGYEVDPITAHVYVAECTDLETMHFRVIAPYDRD